MKKSFLFILAVLLPVVASAYDAVINNIAYDFDQNERTATVTMGPTPPSNLIIPATVTYNGEEYWVTGIASMAFYGSSGITSVTIGPNVTSIGSQAFAYCSSLSSVTLLNFNIFEIWESVFSDYHYSSTTLYVPKGFKDAYEDWGWDRFQKMVETDRALAAVKIGSIYYNLIPELSMAEVTNSRGGITGTEPCYSGTVNIPSTVNYGGKQYDVTSIGEDAFYSCGALTSVILPGSVTSIGQSAFNYCMKLSSIEIPNSVKRIGSQAFYSCSSLTSISLPNVVSMGDEVFHYCTGLQWFTIPWAVTTIKNNTFYGCSSLTSVGIHDGVTSIGRSAFRDCSSLESVTIPKSVTSIGDYAFYNCSNLTSVTSLITNPFAISNNVFAGMDYSFTSATLYVHFELKWEYWSTSGWNNFQNVEGYIPKIDGIYYYLSLGLKEAIVTNRTGGDGNGGGSYSGSVTIPATIDFDGEEYPVTNIGDRAFYECSELTSVTIPDGVKSIGEYAFYRCGTLTSVILPGSVTSIGNSAFAYCSKLESVTIPDGVTSIGSYAFQSCRGLTSVILPGSVTSIGNSAFAYCSKLESVTIPDSMTSIGGHAFEGCSSLISITLPDGVTSIGEATFDDCSGLTSVNMGNSVTSIGVDAFGGCSKLTSITIPGSVTSIGDVAFLDCSSLSVITSLITDPFEIDEYVFDNSVYTSATLFVPKGTKAKYEAIPAWNMFQKIEEIVVKGDVNDDGAVDVADISTVIDVMAGKALEYKAKADVNKDKTVDVADIAIIIDIMAGKDVEPQPSIVETKTFTVNGVSFTMIGVEGGTFQMGSDDSDAFSVEQPVHPVTVSSFCIGQTEVTQELWYAVMSSNPSYFKGSGLPVETVSWNDCQEFITKLNQLTGQQFRLPTEAEWEYAARGGNKSKGYKYAGSNTVGDVAWYWDNIPSQTSGNPGFGTQPVATKHANELGIYDMSGNVYEWCSDWYGSYSSNAQTDPTGASSGSYRVRRGGCWDSTAGICRVSYRGYGTPSSTYDYLGLRLAL